MNLQFRQHFPFFSKSPEWTYLDSAATTLKPQVLIDATSDFYASAGSVHRSQYDVKQSQDYELARDLVAQRFHVESRDAVVWTSGTTHAINLVAYGLEAQIQPQDEIVISVAEHHANFIPWQQLAERSGAKLVVLPLDAQFQIAPETLCSALNERTKIVAFNLVSNVTGVRQPVERLIPLIRQYSQAKILLDCAQAVCCEQIDVQALDADFYAFSAHKMYGPNGVGVLMGKRASMAQLKPLFYGGKMLQDVSTRHLVVADLPYRLEAGTPNIAGIIAFGQVLKWLNEWDFEALNQGLYQLAETAYKRLKRIENLQMLSHPTSTTLSFSIQGQHHADLAAILTENHVALRAGEHCAKPYLRYLEKQGTLRLSLAHYNQMEDLECFFRALEMALSLLAD